MPDVPLADEPTSALDPTSRTALLDLLDDWVREHGLSVLIPTHDPEVEARAGRAPRLAAARPAACAAADQRPLAPRRAHERRVGQACVSPWRSRCRPSQ